MSGRKWIIGTRDSGNFLVTGDQATADVMRDAGKAVSGPYVLEEQLTEAVKDLERARGVLTLWGNLAPTELLNLAPGPNGKTLAQLTHESFAGQS